MQAFHYNGLSSLKFTLPHPGGGREIKHEGPRLAELELLPFDWKRGAAAHSQGASSAWAASTSAWACSVCTLNNSPSAKACMVCGTKRAEAKTPEAPADMVVFGCRQEGKAFLFEVQPVKEPPPPWRCVQCTTIVPGSAVVCSHCMAPHPLFNYTWTCSVGCGAWVQSSSFRPITSCSVCGRPKQLSPYDHSLYHTAVADPLALAAQEPYQCVS